MAASLWGLVQGWDSRNVAAISRSAYIQHLQGFQAQKQMPHSPTNHAMGGRQGALSILEAVQELL